MQNDTSRFVSNIIPLQNINSNIGGINAVTVLSNTVVGLQQMINTDTRTVKANFLQSFSGGHIGVLSELNLCNVGITSNGTAFSSTGSNLVLSNLTVSTLVATSGTFSGLCYAQQFVTLSDILAKKDIEKFSGSVLNSIDKIQAYRFSYHSSGQTLGLLAQEVEAVWPEVVAESSGKKFVNYDGLVAVLVRAVQELAEKVRALESRTG